MRLPKLQVVIFLLITEVVGAQNPRLSQIWAAPMLLNPSLSGRFDGKMRLAGQYSWQETNRAEVTHQNYYIDFKFGKYRHVGDEEQYTLPKPDSAKIVVEAKDETGLKINNKGFWSAGLNYFHYGDDDDPLRGDFYSATIARHFYKGRNAYFGFGFQAVYAQGDLDETRGTEYSPEISADGFRYPHGVPSTRKNTKEYWDFNFGGYYGMSTEPVSFELGLAMYHLFYPDNAIVDKDPESELRHRLTGHSLLRLKLNEQWGFVQRNMFWQQGLYYKSKSVNDSAHIVTLYCGVELYKTQPKTNINFNFGMYTRSFKTVMPFVNLGLGKMVNLRYSYEFPINSAAFVAYTARRSEVVLILTYKKNTPAGLRFSKKVNYW